MRRAANGYPLWPLPAVANLDALSHRMELSTMSSPVDVYLPNSAYTGRYMRSMFYREVSIYLDACNMINFSSSLSDSAPTLTPCRFFVDLLYYTTIYCLIEATNHRMPTLRRHADESKCRAFQSSEKVTSLREAFSTIIIVTYLLDVIIWGLIVDTRTLIS